MPSSLAAPLITLPLTLFTALLFLHNIAAAQDAIPLGDYSVRPNPAYEKSTIAVAPFDVSNASVEMEAAPRIIRKNLELSGFFRLPSDRAEVSFLNRQDHRSGKVSFERWQEFGVDQYLMGRIVEEGEQMTISVLLYDIDSRKMILRRNISGPRKAFRQHCHRISDLVIEYITGFEGVCTTKILFATEQIPGNREIAVMDWDGYNTRKITNFGSISTYPAWGANGTEMYYMSYKGNRAKILGQLLTFDATYSISGGKFWTIAAYGGTNHSPVWSQEARRLAMVLSKDGNSEIYTAKRDGTDLRRLTKTKSTEGSPTWSPDGTKIAFTSDAEGGVHLYVMNADGSNKRRITRQGSWCDAASWSPDGSRIAFTYRSGGVNDIYVASIDGSNFRRLTQNQGNNESPTWAPNGVHIAFTSDRSGSKQIYLMLDDGSNQRPLTTTGRNLIPAWGPILPFE